MRADAFPINTVLNERQQWVVPVYQRHYGWETDEDKQIPKLWADLQDQALERLEHRTVYQHYFGAIISYETQGQRFGSVRQRFLVDGQQRVTTFQLVLIAIREVSRKREVLHYIDVLNAYLFNDKGPGMLDPDREYFKLWPSSYDRGLYQDIIQNKPDDLRTLKSEYFYKNGNLKKGQAPNLLRAYLYLITAIDEFIQERLDDFGNSIEDTLDAIIDGFLSGFRIVLIQLDQDDDAQEIFASLNGMGKPLSPFDLIRNDVFHRARKTGEDDQVLFDERWKLFEQPFWTQLVRQGRFNRARADHLIAHAVVAETAQEANVGKIASEYQRYAHERAFPTVAAELDVLITHAETYRMMEPSDEKGILSRIAYVLRTWDSSAFHPLIFAVNSKRLDDEQKTELFQLLESYIVRREICGLTRKNYNKVVVGFVKQVRESGNSLDAFKEYMAGLTGDISRMPTDVQLSEAFVRRQAYDSIQTPRLRFILEQLEYGHRTKFDEVTVSTGNLTIEHVMPIKWAANWPLDGGMKAPCESSTEAIDQGREINDEMKTLMDDRQRYINTFGNLTLLTAALNPSVSNAGWSIKREKIGQSLLAINRDLAASDQWSEAEIEKRAGALAKVAVTIWPAI